MRITRKFFRFVYNCCNRQEKRKGKGKLGKTDNPKSRFAIIGLVALPCSALLITIENTSVLAQRSENRSAVVLTGNDLTIDDVVGVARRGMSVQATPEALDRVRRSHQLLLLAASQDQPIYGLNRGVGLNKDRSIFEGDTLSAEARQASEQFNANLLRSHSAGMKPELSEEVVRAVMLARVNTMLLGRTGVSQEVVQMYLDLINRRIHPVVPSRGSVGQADITILPHIGLAMMGEGEVIFEQRRMEAREALAKAGLQPIRPYAKDALSIVSSNAYSAGMGVLVIHDIERMLETADRVFALSLEGLNGNVAPLLQSTHDVRPYSGQGYTAGKIRDYLQGSYLWQPHQERSLQDPLSFRTASQVHGAARDALDFLKQQIKIQLNSSDDNPAVILSESVSDNSPEVALGYTVRTETVSGMVVPSANFEPLPWVVGFEMVGIALNHVAYNSCYRTIKLGTDHFTHLSRFLSPDDNSIAFGTIQKSYTSLCTEVRSLSQPVSVDYFSVAGEIEDHATNAPFVVQRVANIVDNLYYILGMELLHGTQAIDLRLRSNPNLSLGRGSRTLYGAYRQAVPFLDRDRTLTIDIQKSYDFLTSFTGSSAAKGGLYSLPNQSQR
ncbi:MAG: aromatic amino acid ammonia-lyase [Coleofasciculus chthonoplastes F3-SA18-01]|uniref:HAL/PAL/TAL family ammonia-lyase n=1 Tax=Coleofasciculus chthonoplastes TaxID=64178 RepID=UPI0032FC1134